MPQYVFLTRLSIVCNANHFHCKFDFKHSDNIFARGLSACREYMWCKAFLGHLCECVANAVSLISNILTTFLREAHPHIGNIYGVKHFWDIYASV